MPTADPDLTPEWVATDLMVVCDESTFYESGGVYDHRPEGKGGASHARPLVAGEYTVACPHCGLRFVAIGAASAEENRDLHVTGDEDCPSICGHHPRKDQAYGRLPTLIGNGATGTPTTS